MIKLTRYLKGYIKESILAPVFKLLEAVFELLVPLVIASLIDNGILLNNKNHIVFSGFLLLAMCVVGLISSITAQYYSAKVASGLGTSLRNDLFEHIFSLSNYETDVVGKSTLISRLTNDTTQIQNGFNLFFRLVLRSPFIVLGAIILACNISIEIGLVFVLVILVLSLIVYLIMNYSIKNFKNIQLMMDDLLNKISENLEGVRVIRAFLNEQREINDFKKSSENLKDKQLKVTRVSSLMNPLTYVVVNVGLVIILNKGGISVNVGSLSQGEVVALVNYMSQILVELFKVATLVNTLSKASTSAKRVNEVFEYSNCMVDGLKEATIGDIVFDNVSFKYPKAKSNCLNNISFGIKANETIGIIGGTGSGKTTLVSLLLRLYDTSDGSIYIDGFNIKEYSIKSLRSLIGIVLQKVSLFKGSIKTNLLNSNRNASDLEINDALNYSLASDFVSEKEDGINSKVEQFGRNFSGGQKQRLNIARALIKKPKLLIFDDSFSALDYKTDLDLRKSIKNNFNDTTVIMVSQRVSSIKNADKIIVLDNGNMVGLGKHEELLLNCNIYKEIYDSQAYGNAYE